MTPEQNIQGHAFNALTYALGSDPWLPLSERERIAKAIVAALEPVIRAYERITPALPEDAREFIANLARGKTLEQAREDEAAWRGSADLNEAYLAGIILRAAELLEKYPSPAAETPAS